jgi:hypothetical protein
LLVLLAMLKRGFVFQQLKVSVKIGKIIKAAFVTYIRNGVICLRKQLTGMMDPDLR